MFGITAAARLAEATVRLRRGMVANEETIHWADPNAFDVLPLPVVAENLPHALDRPDAIVITRSAARRYFGIDVPLARQLVIDKGRLATVTVVIADPQAYLINLSQRIHDHKINRIDELLLWNWRPLAPLEQVA